MKNFKIKAKILTGFVISSLFMLLLGGIGAIGLKKVNDSYSGTIALHGKPLVNIGKALVDLQASRFELRGLILYNDNTEQVRRMEATIMESLNEFEALMGDYVKTIIRPDARQFCEEAMDIYVTTYKPTLLKVIGEVKKGRSRDELLRYLVVTRPASAEMLYKLIKMMNIKDEMMDRTVAEVNADATVISLMFLGVFITAAAVSFFFGLYVSSLICKPLSALTAFMNKASVTGDLTLDSEEKKSIDGFAKGRDEIGLTIAACDAFIERVTAVSGILEAVSRGDLTAELPALSSNDTIALSIRKMTDGLNSMIKEIEQRDYLLHAVNRTADILLRADEHNFEASLEEGLALMADCLGVDRILIWKAEAGENVFSYYLDYRYANSYASPGKSFPLGAVFPYYTGFEKSSSRQDSINGPVSGLPDEWQSLSRDYKVKSVLMLPLFLRDDFWGQISFADFRRERVFSENEVSILRSASLMIANARNRHEEAALIREADHRTRIMLDTMPLCCQVWSRNLSILDCNEAAVKHYGFRDKLEYIDRFFELSPERQPDGRRSDETVYVWLRKAFEGQYCVFEWMHQMPDGTPIPSEIILSRVKFGNEDVVIGYTRDLREQHMMMKRIESLLLETQAANHAKSEFMARMSHEMLTPMNAIMGLTQVALMSELPDDIMKGYLEEINKASNQLLQLINDVLEMSNMTFDIFKLDNLAFSFTSVFDDALKVVGRFMEAKQQVFTFEIDRSIPPLLIGDRRRLGQVMVKIMENAAKFTPEHGEIRFSALALDKDAEVVTLRVEVEDNGQGIAEERKKSLFNVFEQIDGGNTRKHGGIGLGLALAKRIVEMMGGRIWVDSELGKGSKFTFTCKVQQQGAGSGPSPA
ncbi:MAG: MCP four helix bundle domain-containing protein [Candidatus Adiutrix sp.]|jgi:signal transduction histidine kinase|nr:MCP four helix bundle domain-containing protein [Candidatus Adiutrix sp.]